MAERYLIAGGMRCITRNYRCKAGEIDLIMADGEVLVFVEIRSRSDSQFGSPIETVTATKQRRIIRAARHYLQSHFRTAEPPCRFDVIGVHGIAAAAPIDWVKDAFTA
jgi:putative endonuclease